MKPTPCVGRTSRSVRDGLANRRLTDFEVRPAPAARRGGSSLTEVLIAILIMSVGILGVMTLFPISIIRSLQATQLTNATILAKRADALIDMFRMVADDFIPQPVEGSETHAVIDPFGWHDLVAGGAGALAQEYGNDGAATPAVVRYAPQPPAAPTFINESGAGTQRYRDVDSNGLVPLRRISYAVDPINPGANAVYPQPYPPPATAPLTPYFTSTPATAPITARDAVLAAVGLPDSFSEVFRSEPDGSNGNPPTQVFFNMPKHDLSYAETHAASFPGSTNAAQEVKLVPGSRIVLMDSTGRRSQIRTVTYDGSGVPNGVAVYPTATQWIVAWADPLPANFGQVAEARIEVPQSRYTWMLTIRKKGTGGGSVTDIDCAVFFNRPTGDPAQEVVHAAFVPDPTIDPTYATPYDSSTSDRPPPLELLTIAFTGGVEPPIRKGGFLFDPTNCLWYRILDVPYEDPAGTYAAVQLERDAEYAIPNVIIPEGVINVFPLPSRVDQSRLNKARRSRGGGG